MRSWTWWRRYSADEVASIAARQTTSCWSSADQPRGVLPSARRFLIYYTRANGRRRRQPHRTRCCAAEAVLLTTMPLDHWAVGRARDSLTMPETDAEPRGEKVLL